jgi:hypothetical protein
MARWVKSSTGAVIKMFEQSTAPTTLEGVTLSDLWVDTFGTPTLKLCTSTSPVTFAAVGGGGGSAAPSDAQYVVLASNGTLTNESVLAVGSDKLTLTGATLDVDDSELSIATSQLTGTISNAQLANSAVADLSGVNTGDQTITLTGDVTGSGTGSFSTTIGNSKVTNDMLAGSITPSKITGTAVTGGGTCTGTCSGTNTGNQNLFSTIAVSGQSNVVADSTSDTLTLAAGSNITLTTNATTDTITIAASGGSGPSPVIKGSNQTLSDNVTTAISGLTSSLTTNSLYNLRALLSITNTASPAIVIASITNQSGGTNTLGLVAGSLSCASFATTDGLLVSGFDFFYDDSMSLTNPGGVTMNAAAGYAQPFYIDLTFTTPSASAGSLEISLNILIDGETSSTVNANSYYILTKLS